MSRQQYCFVSAVPLMSQAANDMQRHWLITYQMEDLEFLVATPGNDGCDHRPSPDRSFNSACML